MMNVAINGRFLTHYTSGVVRVATEFTKALDALIVAGKISGSFRLLCPERASAERLGLKAISIEHVGGRLTGHTWEQLALPYYAGKDTLLCLGNTAPIYSLVRGNQVGVMIHDLSYRLFPEAYQWRYRVGHTLLAPLLLRFSNPLFTVSESEKEIIESLSPSLEDHIVVAQNGGWRGVGEKLLTRRPVAPSDGYALYVGSLSERKNIHGVEATAIRLARKFGIRTKLVGSGGGIFQYAKPEIPSDLSHLIEYCGQIEEREELSALYQGARLLLFPSFYEASSLPPIEAMHFGCPVVAADIPSLRERCGDAAEYCDPHSVDSIFNAANNIITNRKRANELVRKGYKRQALYNWETQVHTVLQSLNRFHNSSYR